MEEFPKQLSVPILMPVGPKVFVRAQLCNTNEVFIRYNDVFTKQSAHEAKAVCERQIKSMYYLENQKTFLYLSLIQVNNVIRV